MNIIFIQMETLQEVASNMPLGQRREREVVAGRVRHRDR